MASIAERLYAITPVGGTCALPRAGTALENLFVHDAVARDLKQRVQHGQLEIVSESTAWAGAESLINHLEFRRLN